VKRKTLITWSFLVILSAVMVAFLSHPADADAPNDILIVANRNVSTKSISLVALKKCFLKQKQSWDGGGKIVPVNAQRGSRLRAAFREAVLGMDEDQELRYWQEQKIRKAISPPSAFNDTLKVVYHVPGSVSYVFRKDYKENVSKVLLVIPAKK
jgi:ABC-type phosphate transport system substrate-binding protein